MPSSSVSVLYVSSTQKQAGRVHFRFGRGISTGGGETDLTVGVCYGMESIERGECCSRG